MNTFTADKLRIPDVADVLGISLRTTWRRINAGLLPVVREGRRTFVPRAALDAYIERIEASSDHAA